MSTIEKAMQRLRTGESPPSKPATPSKPPPAERPPPEEHARPADTPLPVHETVMQQPTVQLDLHRLRRMGIYPPVSMEKPLRDQYRRIKRPLLAGATGRGAAGVERGNLIMVTSAVAGEGKTFTTLNLALSMARDPDITITLVDGDVSRAHITRMLGVAERPGLLDLLADESLAAGEVILPTSVDSLSLLPAGRQHALSEELLSSERMERVVNALADPTRRHILLFDSAPLLASPEAVTLSQNVGQILLVVKASSTLRHQVTAAMDTLDPNKAIQLLLNQSLGGLGTDDYYGSYYGDAADGAR